MVCCLFIVTCTEIQCKAHSSCYLVVILRMSTIDPLQEQHAESGHVPVSSCLKSPTLIKGDKQFVISSLKLHDLAALDQ